MGSYLGSSHVNGKILKSHIYKPLNFSLRFTVPRNGKSKYTICDVTRLFRHGEAHIHVNKLNGDLF